LVCFDRKNPQKMKKNFPVSGPNFGFSQCVLGRCVVRIE